MRSPNDEPRRDERSSSSQSDDPRMGSKTIEENASRQAEIEDTRDELGRDELEGEEPDDEGQEVQFELDSQLQIEDADSSFEATDSATLGIPEPDPKTPKNMRSDTMSAQPATGPQLAYSRTHHREKLREASDKDLLMALMGDDEAALDEIIERKMAPLLKTVRRILGDLEESRDIVQVTFFRLWEHRQRFDARWSANTWIYRIATNLAIDHLRSRQSRQRATEPMRMHIQSVHENRSRRDRAELHENEVMGIFRELSADLTDKQRLIFVLREIEGLPSKEVAEIAGCRESTVRNHLFNARKILRKELLERYPEYARSVASPSSVESSKGGRGQR